MDVNVLLFDDFEMQSSLISPYAGKSIDYAALRHRDMIIAKIDLFIQRITHNLWHARKKCVFN